MPKKIKPDENMIYRGATVDGDATINEEERRVPIVISTEAPTRICRGSYKDGYSCFPQILKHTTESVVVNRENIKLLDGHRRLSLPLGRLENIRVEDSVLRADAIFSKVNPNADIPWKMVLEKTLDEISVGGLPIEKETKKDENGLIVEETITKWELLEASLVVMGADANAGVNRNLNIGDDVSLEEILRELGEIKTKLENVDDDGVQRELKTRQIELEAEKLKLEKDDLQRQLKERDRKDAIMVIARENEIAEDDDTLKRFLNDENKDEGAFAREILNMKRKNQVDVGFYPAPATQGAELTRALTDTLIIRAGVPLSEPHKDVRRYMGASLLDICRYMTGYEGHNPQEIVKRALSSSALPNLLLSVTKRVLDTKWDEAETTYQMWTGVDYFDDFRAKQHVNRKSINGTFSEKYENGEPKYVTFEENGRAWSIARYGEKIVLTDVMIINDDMGVFLDLVGDIIRKAKRTINTHVYDMLLREGVYKNYNMGDGKPIFHANHNNIGEAAALGAEGLEKLDVLLGNQTEKDSKGNEIALNIDPTFLLVGRKNRIKARTILNSSATTEDGGNSGIVNPFKNLYTLVEEQRLGDSYFLAAKRKTITVGFLNGNTEHMPIIDISDRNLDGITFNIALDFGVTCEDYKGLSKNEGVA